MRDEDARVFGPYFDGEAEVYADPLETHRLLARETRGQLPRLLQLSQDVGPDDAEGDDAETLLARAAARDEADRRAFPAIEALLAAARIAFRMRPFDPATGTGATERHCHRALNDFLVYLGAEKKDTGSSPTSAAPAAPASSGGPSPSASSSASGSTSTGSGSRGRRK